MSTDDTKVSIAIRIEPFLMKTGVPFVGDIAALAEQITGYVAENLSQRFTADHPNAGLFVAVSVQRGEESAGHQYREVPLVSAPTVQETP